jgi:hypothetical protein
MIPRKIGTKILRTVPETRGLNKWINRPACTKDALPMKGALSIYTGINPLSKCAAGHLGYINVVSNDVQHVVSSTFTVSGVYGGSHGISITPAVFDKTMVTWAVRQVIKPSWINWADQLSQPNIELPEEFITSCAVYDLFHGKNQTSSLKDVKYKGSIYQVRNQFFPYSVNEIKNWGAPTDLSGQLRIAKDTFVATWLQGKILSPESQAVLDAGRKVYEVFYKEWNNLNLHKFKIDYWDVGWYQIHNALHDARLGLAELNALKEAHTKLANKLRPKVYEYGFLDQEILYTEEN